MLQVCLGAALGISKPSALLWFKSDLFTYGLGFLMLSMGLTLTIKDFKQVGQPPAGQGGSSLVRSALGSYSTVEVYPASTACHCAHLGMPGFDPIVAVNINVQRPLALTLMGMLQCCMLMRSCVCSCSA